MDIKIKYGFLLTAVFYQFGFSQETDKNFSVNNSGLKAIIEIEKLNYQRSTEAILRQKRKGYKEFISDGKNDKQLVGEDKDGFPLYYTSLNAPLSKMIKTNKLYSEGGLGLSISGKGMTIGQWDYSKPRLNHELISGKVTYDGSQNQTISRHSTHIAGTLVGRTGIAGQEAAIGVAYDATAKAYDWSNDVSEMAKEALYGLLVANNSYGYDPLYYQSYQFGKYNTTAQEWDNLMYNAPYFQIVKAAGNARNIDANIVPQSTAKGGYDLLEGAGISKNVLVVTSVQPKENMVNDSDFNISNFSSYGPTDDGRIKPDIAALGENVYSSIDTYNSAYGIYDGTSSATASVAASLALLQQYWKSLNPINPYLWSSSVRALLAHTANDTGALGPDYIYGWGLMNTERAAQLIYNNNKSTLIKEETLNNGGEYKLYVVGSQFELQPLVATLAWTDPQGNINNTDEDDTTGNLINDLDITIVKKDDVETVQTFYPWKLSGMQNRTAPATRTSDNKVDNIEKVEIGQPSGLYQVIIKHKNTLQSGSQKFSLVLSGISFCYTDDLYVLTREKDNIETSNFTGTAKKIKASNVIKTAAKNIVYKASNSIELLPDATGGSKTVGFTAEEGSGFSAYIEPDCSLSDATLIYHTQAGRSSGNDGGTPGNPANTLEQLQNIVIYPNPAKTEVSIAYKIQEESTVKILLTDMSGKTIKSNISTASFPKGDYKYQLSLTGLASGTYILVVETASYTETKKLIIQ